jgi:hypothetical protein
MASLLRGGRFGEAVRHPADTPDDAYAVVVALVTAGVEAAAVVACFAVLGRTLGLWRTV